MSKKVLIVDDESFIRVLLGQTLEDFEEAGIELLMAANGSEAWEVTQTEQPDLIILDVMMPGLSGYEVCRRVKCNPVLSKVYVIMLTAKGQDRDRRRGEEVGADEFITKPFDPDDLVERVSRALGISV